MSVEAGDVDHHILPLPHREVERPIAGRGGGGQLAAAVHHVDAHGGERTNIVTGIGRIEYDLAEDCDGRVVRDGDCGLAEMLQGDDLTGRTKDVL